MMKGKDGKEVSGRKKRVKKKETKLDGREKKTRRKTCESTKRKITEENRRKEMKKT